MEKRKKRLLVASIICLAIAAMIAVEIAHGAADIQYGSGFPVPPQMPGATNRPPSPFGPQPVPTPPPAPPPAPEPAPEEPAPTPTPETGPATIGCTEKTVQLEDVEGFAKLFVDGIFHELGKAEIKIEITIKRGGQ